MPDGHGFTVTNEVLFEHIERLRVQVGDLQTEVKLTKQATQDARAERDSLRSRLEKVETRINGVFIGLGTGVAIGAFWLLRGAVTP